VEVFFVMQLKALIHHTNIFILLILFCYIITILQAANLISDAITEAGNGIIEIRRIDTAKDVALTVARSRNVTYIPSSSGGAGTNLLLNLGTQ
jgi:hypothetical protein